MLARITPRVTRPDPNKCRLGIPKLDPQDPKQRKPTTFTHVALPKRAVQTPGSTSQWHKKASGFQQPGKSSRARKHSSSSSNSAISRFPDGCRSLRRWFHQQSTGSSLVFPPSFSTSFYVDSHRFNRPSFCSPFKWVYNFSN